MFDDTKTDSGSVIHRYFCGACGSALFSYPDLFPGAAFIKVRCPPKILSEATSTFTSNVDRSAYTQVGILDKAAEIKPKAEICQFFLSCLIDVSC